MGWPAARRLVFHVLRKRCVVREQERDRLSSHRRPSSRPQPGLRIGLLFR
jgi:hypothetical protein